MNLYAIDDNTRMPIAGAMVAVGTVTGTTDATGLFVAMGVTGPQTVAVSAGGYRGELWIGANGANMTADLHAAVDPTTTQANLAGTIVGFDQVSVPTGHHKTAVVSFSSDDHATSAENNLTTANSTNICDTPAGTATCTFTVTTRTGHVALLAAILDHDLNGTPTDPSDDTFTIIGWASLGGLVVVDGVDQTGDDLTMLSAADVGSVTVDFGTPPASLPNVLAIAGVDLGTDGVLEVPQLVAPTAPTIAVAPKLSGFPSATYRLTALASDTTGSSQLGSQSAELIRGIAQPQLAAGTWLGVPGGVSLTRTGGSWTALAGALVQGATYDTDATHHLLSITSFDGTATFTIPAQLALPTTGALLGTATALQGTIDLTNFSIDNDISKITGSAQQQLSLQ